jgi:hypothetical protein
MTNPGLRAGRRLPIVEDKHLLAEDVRGHLEALGRAREDALTRAGRCG